MWTDEWTDEWTDVWTDEWIDVWTDEWTDVAAVAAEPGHPGRPLASGGRRGYWPKVHVI